MAANAPTPVPPSLHSHTAFPSARGGRQRLYAILPVAVSLLAFANTVPGDFVFDDVVLLERGEALRELDPGRIFASNYWGADRMDKNYRPLTLLTHALNFALGRGAWSFHVVNVLINAGVALLAYCLLLELLRDAGLAALCATLYTVLPVHVEAVANVVGRAELLAGGAIFAAWLLALKHRGREQLLLALGAGLIAFLGLFTKENAVVAAPLILAASIALRRKVPWLTVGLCAAAVAAYLGIREIVLAGKEAKTTFVDNPLFFTDGVTRTVNAVCLVGLYLAKTAAPVHLSADYSYNQLPVLPLGDPLLWCQALIVLGGLTCLLAFSWKRAPLIALAVVFFGVTIAPTTNIAFPIGTIFGERLAYTPSFAYPLLLGALASTGRLRKHGRAVRVALCILVLAYAGRTWARNRDWADSTAMDLRMAADAPSSTRAQLKAAEGHVELSLKAAASGVKESHLQKAIERVSQSLAILPSHGRAMAKQGEILFLQGQYAAAGEMLTEAGRVMSTSHPPESEPLILFLRGQCYLRLGRPGDALEDFRAYVKLIERGPTATRGTALNFRGLALAALGRLEEALADFNQALALRQDSPEIWSNRAYCRFLGKDPDGAIADYRQGLELWRQQGVLHAARGDSAWSFLRRIAEVHTDKAKHLRAAGDEAAARLEEEQAAAAEAEAETLKKRAGLPP